MEPTPEQKAADIRQEKVEKACELYFTKKGEDAPASMWDKFTNEELDKEIMELEELGIDQGKHDDQGLEERVTTQPEQETSEPSLEAEQGAPEGEEETQEDELTPAESVGLAQYRITGMVDQFDEQGVIRGQYPNGSIQELPANIGDRAVEAGQAEKMVE